MQRPLLFESDGFIYWKNRFETYVKSKDLDLLHIITYGDFPPVQNNSKTKKDEIVPFDKQNDDLKKKLAKNNEAKMIIYNALPRKEYERNFMCKTEKENWDTLLITYQGNIQVKDNIIDLLVQQYEQFTIPKEESIDRFARFNTIITSLKALVTAIEESKDLTSLSLDELIENLKVYEVILKKDSKMVKGKREQNRFVRQPHDERKSSQRNKDDKNDKSERKCFKCGDPNHLIREFPKLSRNHNQRAYVGGSWSDSDEEEEEKTKDEKCLMDKASNVVSSETEFFSDDLSSLDEKDVDSEYNRLCKIDARTENTTEIRRNLSRGYAAGTNDVSFMPLTKRHSTTHAQNSSQHNTRFHPQGPGTHCLIQPAKTPSIPHSEPNKTYWPRFQQTQPHQPTFGFNSHQQALYLAVVQNQSASSGSTSQETQLPHAFNTLTLQDPANSNWNMDTGASSHLNSSVNNLTPLRAMVSEISLKLSGWVHHSRCDSSRLHLQTGAIHFHNFALYVDDIVWTHLLAESVYSRLTLLFMQSSP
ncbi:hypothetical protein Tco_0880207 [Tanacetum coccineum]